METTFYNVQITIEAASPKEAYNQLCAALGTLECEWMTDRYVTDEHPNRRRDTRELWPKDRMIAKATGGQA